MREERSLNGLESLSSASLISRYILRLMQAAQKHLRPRCPNRKMYLGIRQADEGSFLLHRNSSLPDKCLKAIPKRQSIIINQIG